MNDMDDMNMSMMMHRSFDCSFPSADRHGGTLHRRLDDFSIETGIGRSRTIFIAYLACLWCVLDPSRSILSTGDPQHSSQGFLVWF